MIPVQTCHQPDFYSVKRDGFSREKKRAKISALFMEVPLKEQKHIGKFLYFVFLLIFVWTCLRVCSVTARTVSQDAGICTSTCVCRL